MSAYGDEARQSPPEPTRIGGAVLLCKQTFCHRVPEQFAFTDDDLLFADPQDLRISLHNGDGPSECRSHSDRVRLFTLCKHKSRHSARSDHFLFREGLMRIKQRDKGTKRSVANELTPAQIPCLCQAERILPSSSSTEISIPRLMQATWTCSVLWRTSH